MLDSDEWQDISLKEPGENLSSNVLRLLTWFRRRRLMPCCLLRPPRSQRALDASKTCLDAKKAPFLRRELGFRRSRSEVSSTSQHTSSAQSQSFLGTQDRQQAAKEFVRNADSKFVVVLPVCRYDLTMKKKIDYVCT